MAATYTVSTNDPIWAKSLIALNANAEANESGEFYTLYDPDLIQAIRYSLDMWLDGGMEANEATDEELMQFARSLRRFADRIERIAHRGDAAEA